MASGGCLKSDPNRPGCRCESTSALGVPDIDWSAPWLHDWRGVGEPIARQIVVGIPQAQALNHAGRAPVRFVPQSDLPDGQAYEDFIFATGQVPTREGLHDFFNGLAWLKFPLTKRRLNQLHVAQIAQTGIQPVRGPARDALTVFDENAAFFQGPDALWNALVAKDWQADDVRGITLSYTYYRATGPQAAAELEKTTTVN